MARNLDRQLFPLVPLPKKCVTRCSQTRFKRHCRVSISSTSEEVRDTVYMIVQPVDKLVSISSTSEEVRDTITATLTGTASKFPLVPLPKKCVTVVQWNRFAIILSFH